VADDSPADAQGLSRLPPPSALFRLSQIEVTGYVVIAQREIRSVVGTMEDVEALYGNVRRHNLLFGWWSIIIAPIWTLMALSRNRNALLECRRLAAAGTIPAGWRPDPTGHHPMRYWDGQAWTDQVSGDVTTDPV
jgi:hypothetical protein